MSSLRAWTRPGALPLLPFAPSVVVLVGAAVAIAMTLFGLLALRRTSDEGATEKALVLVSALSRRVRMAPAEDREALLERAARRTGADLLLVDQQGRLLADTIVGAEPSTPIVEMLTEGAGFTETSTGRAAYGAAQLPPPFEHLALVALVHAPAAPPGARALVRAVLILASILIGIAAVVAYIFSKNARDDVDFVRHRIEQMALAESAPLGEPVPLRTFDQVGVVTSAFNALLDRFAAADRSYRHDLEQADAIDRARARFLATLSHELRTPLNAILGFADVLLSEVDGPLSASAREDLEVIRSSGDHLRALIDDILDLSAMEMGSLRLERREVDVHALAEQVVRETAPQVAGRPVSLRVVGAPGAVARVDPRRVRQILANLVGNAIKFTPSGEVEVRVSALPGSIVLEVRDTGPGIAESEIATLFEEYRQAGDAASRRKGTGLGLAIAKRLALMHDGSISLKSELGLGSTFRVELPIAPRLEGSSGREERA